MRYELIDREWAAIRPMLPNNLVGIFWVLRSGVPWRYLPKEFGPYTTCYNRFVRWRRARVWSRIMAALAAAHDAAVHSIRQLFDSSARRLHRRQQEAVHGPVARRPDQHAVVDRNRLPVWLALTAGEAHDNRLCIQTLVPPEIGNNVARRPWL
jgi:transposase